MLTFQLNGQAIEEPTGFDSFSMKGRRNEWHGFYAQVSELPLRFECDNGGDAIRAAYQQDGQDAAMNFEVLCEGTGVLFARLEFNTYEDFGDYVAVNVEEVNFEGKLKTRLKTAVDLSKAESLDGEPITPQAVVPLEMHSQAISKSSVWMVEEDTLEQQVNTADTLVYLQGMYGYTVKDELETTSDLPFAWNPTLPADFYNVTEGGVHEITIQLNVLLNIKRVAPGPITVTAGLAISGQPGATLYTVTDNSSNDVSLTINVPYTDTFTLTPGTLLRYFVRVERTDGGVPTVGYYKATALAGSTLSVRAATFTPKTLTDGYLVRDVFKGLAKAILGPDGSATSDYYDPLLGCGGKRIVTSGLRIRNVPAPLTTTLQEALSACHAIDCIGANIEQGTTAPYTLRVEYFRHFYNDAVAFTLTYEQVSSYKESVALEVIYNKVTAGYKKWETEFGDGLAEFNSRREWATPIRNYENEYSIISPWIAGGLPIEVTRREQFAVEPRKDTRYDKDNFVIAVVNIGITAAITGTNSPDNNILGFDAALYEQIAGSTTLTISSGPNAGTYQIDAVYTDPLGTFVYITPALPTNTLGNATFIKWAADHPLIGNAQIIAPEIGQKYSYNVELTPARNVLRHGEWLRIGTHYKPDSSVFSFQAGEGNYTISTFNATATGCNEESSTGLVLTSLPEDYSFTLPDLADDYPAEPNLIELEAYLTPTEYRALVNKCIRPRASDPVAYGLIEVQKPEGTAYGWLFGEFSYNYANNRLTCNLLKKNA